MVQARRASAALGEAVYTKFPLKAGMSPMSDDLTELVLNRTWRPQLAVTGIDGLPAPTDAGNVLLPSTVAKLSLRLPPTLDAAKAADTVRTLLEKDPPYEARVAYEPESNAVGWHAPALSPWLEQSLARVSETTFGAPPAYMGEGGTIPFMAMLGEKFPQAQFVVTGVLGPHSNAHGPHRGVETRGTESLLTLRWREADSNLWSRMESGRSETFESDFLERRESFRSRLPRRPKRREQCSALRVRWWAGCSYGFSEQQGPLGNVPAGVACSRRSERPARSRMGRMR